MTSPDNDAKHKIQYRLSVKFKLYSELDQTLQDANRYASNHRHYNIV